MNVWCFDLDGCLVDSLAATHLRPHADVLLAGLVERGAEVRIWSAGGADYAERVAHRVGIADWITSYHDKDRGPSGFWDPPPVPDGHALVCIDDQPDGEPPHVETIAVFPYLGRSPHDSALRRITDELDWRFAKAS